jgi:hypothetical protein
MIVGFLALHFLGKTYVLCVIDISLCDCGCDRGLIFHKNISRRDFVFNNGVIVRSGESQEYIKCIGISTCYQSHGRPRSHGSEVRTLFHFHRSRL